MVRHVLAPIVPLAAESLRVERTLSDGYARDAVALTFDDGPHPEGTPAMLEILAAGGARATFFVIGEQVRARPALTRRILAEGHAMALHGDRHRLQLRLTPDELRADLARGSAAIEDATGTSRATTARPTGSTAPPACESLASAACARCCGRRGARIGEPTRRRTGSRRSPRGRSRRAP